MQFSASLSGSECLLLFALSVLAPWLSWRWVENPVRQWDNKGKTFRIYAAALMASLAMCGITLLFTASNGLEQRYSEKERRILAFLDYQPPETR